MRHELLGATFFTVACVTACAEPRKPATADSVPHVPIAQTTVPAALRFSDETVGDTATRPYGADIVRAAGSRVIQNFCNGDGGCPSPWSIVACTTLTLRSSDAHDAAEIGHVNAGDTVLVETGNTHIASPGLAIVRRDSALVQETRSSDGTVSYDTVRMMADDVVLIWEEHSENYWTIEHKGRRMRLEEFWSGPARISTLWAEAEDDVLAVSLSKPDARLWLRLRPKNGAAGWWERVWPRDRNSTVSVDPDWPYGCPRKM